MRKLLLTTVMLLPLSANAGNYYVSATGEYIAKTNAKGELSTGSASASATEAFKDSFGGLVSAGAYLTNGVRVEAEFGYRELKAKTTDLIFNGMEYISDSSGNKLRAFSGMGNIYYNLPTGTPVSPYIGGGVGIVRDDTNNTNALAYQGMIGVDYKISNNSAMFTGYRYFQAGDFKYNYNVNGLGQVNTKANATIQALDVGYRYSF